MEELACILSATRGNLSTSKVLGSALMLLSGLALGSQLPPQLSTAARQSWTSAARWGSPKAGRSLSKTQARASKDLAKHLGLPCSDAPPA